MGDLENSGYTPQQSSPHRYRVLSDYALNWWATPGEGAALSMLSWKPNVQDAFARFVNEVWPPILSIQGIFHSSQISSFPPTAAEAHEPPSQASAQSITRSLSLALDGVRDALAEVTDTIHGDEAVVAGYKRAIIDERFGVRILARPAAEGVDRDVEPRLAGSSSSAGRKDGIPATSSPVSVKVREWAAGVADSPSSSGDEEGSRASPSSPSVAHARSGILMPNTRLNSSSQASSMDLDLPGGSPVSSTNLTNTSEEDSE